MNRYARGLYIADSIARGAIWTAISTWCWYISPYIETNQAVVYKHGLNTHHHKARVYRVGSIQVLVWRKGYRPLRHWELTIGPIQIREAR